MRELGGNSIFLSESDLQISRGELMKDTAKTLSEYVDIVAIRTYNNSDIQEFIDNSSIPIINALSNTNHPCQALSDIQTVIEKKKSLRNLKIVWIGDSNNVLNDFLFASLKLGANFSIVCPKKYSPNKETIKIAKEILKENKSARLGIIKTHRGIVDTPAFMPVGTQATVKSCLLYTSDAADE